MDSIFEEVGSIRELTSKYELTPIQINTLISRGFLMIKSKNIKLVTYDRICSPFTIFISKLNLYIKELNFAENRLEKLIPANRLSAFKKWQELKLHHHNGSCIENTDLAILKSSNTSNQEP